MEMFVFRFTRLYTWLSIIDANLSHRIAKVDGRGTAKLLSDCGSSSRLVDLWLTLRELLPHPELSSARQAFRKHA